MKRMVDEKDRKKISELTDSDIEKLQGLHLYAYQINLSNYEVGQNSYIVILSPHELTKFADLANKNEIFIATSGYYMDSNEKHNAATIYLSELDEGVYVLSCTDEEDNEYQFSNRLPEDEAPLYKITQLF